MELLAALFIVAPIFALICLGFGAARFKLVSTEAGNGLSEFVFVLAIPALLFRTVSSANLPEINPFPHWISYFATLAVCWIIAYQVARRMGRSRPAVQMLWMRAIRKLGETCGEEGGQ